jgi:hypothetical protein
MKYVHTNLVARDWRKLADFYINVFNCKPVPPERELKGEWLDKAVNVKDAHIKGVHLQLPGYVEDLHWKYSNIAKWNFQRNVPPTLKVMGIWLSGFQMSKRLQRKS